MAELDAEDAAALRRVAELVRAGRPVPQELQALALRMIPLLVDRSDQLQALSQASAQIDKRVPLNKGKKKPGRPVTRTAERKIALVVLARRKGHGAARKIIELQVAAQTEKGCPPTDDEKESRVHTLGSRIAEAKRFLAKQLAAEAKPVRRYTLESPPPGWKPVIPGE